MTRRIPAFTLLLSIAAGASAQGTNPGVLQQRATTTPAQRVTPAQAPATSKPAIAVNPAISAAQHAAVGKTVLPGNILGMEDRAIIIVGGKPVAAAEVKRKLQDELRLTSVPATGSARRIPQSSPLLDLPGQRPGPKLTPKGSNLDPTRVPQTPAYAGGRDTIRANRALSYTEMINYCKTHPAEISRVRGAITPNNRFTIQGMCFGDQTGAVEAIGQFPGGKLNLVFERWTDGEITAFVPAVSGAADHTIALTVVRTDRTRSPAMQARFIATRQNMPVPPRYWSPSYDFVKIDVDQGGGDIFSGYKSWGAGLPQYVAPFSLQINPNCELDSAAWSSSTGRVDAFNGWNNPGPPNVANVEVVWTPRCVTQTTDYVFATSSQRICSVQFELKAWANCPIGLTP
jgi:hypothetical protein